MKYGRPEVRRMGHPTDISKDRYEKSDQKYLNNDKLRFMVDKIRVENAAEERYIYLYGDPNYDHEIFPDVEKPKINT